MNKTNEELESKVDEKIDLDKDIDLKDSLLSLAKVLFSLPPSAVYHGYKTIKNNYSKIILNTYENIKQTGYESIVAIATMYFK